MNSQHLRSLGSLGLFLTYLIATVAGAPRDSLTLFSELYVLPVPFVALTR